MSRSHGSYQPHRGSPGYQVHPGPPEALGRAGTSSTRRHFFLRHDCRLPILRRSNQLSAHKPTWSQECEPQCGQRCAWPTGIFFGGVPARAFPGIPVPESHLTRWLHPRLCPPPQSTSGIPLYLSCPQCYSASIAKNPNPYQSGPSDLELVRPWLPALNGVHAVGFATSFGRSSFLNWAVREHCQCKMAIDSPLITEGQSRNEVSRVIADYVAHTGAERFIVIDAPNRQLTPLFAGWADKVLPGISDALES